MYWSSVVRPWRVVIALGLVAAGLILSGAARASSATCQSAQTPNVGSGQNELLGVAGTSSRNAWAVGYYINGTGVRTLIEHWNGKAWKVQASPINGGSSDSQLFGVAAASSSNAWAVGDYGAQTLVEHWNGKAWKVQASPNPRVFQDESSQLSGVAATSSTNAWAVGYYQDRTGYNTQTLVEHWNGRAWKVQASPNPRGDRHFNQLGGVAATSSTNAWAC
jgi:hypothetical protein